MHKLYTLYIAYTNFYKKVHAYYQSIHGTSCVNFNLQISLDIINVEYTGGS